MASKKSCLASDQPSMASNQPSMASNQPYLASILSPFAVNQCFLASKKSSLTSQ